MLFARAVRPLTSLAILPRARIFLQPYRSAFSTCAPLSVLEKPQILFQDKESYFGFIWANPRTPKPRWNGVTETRGPYYSVMGKRYLADVLETVGYHVDGLKVPGGSFPLFPEKELLELIDLVHSHDIFCLVWRIYRTPPHPS
jgi:hypothetical protein